MRSFDYEILMEANLARAFIERDPMKRNAEICELYAQYAVLNEPTTSVIGDASICDTLAAFARQIAARLFCHRPSAGPSQ